MGWNSDGAPGKLHQAGAVRNIHHVCVRAARQPHFLKGANRMCTRRNEYRFNTKGTLGILAVLLLLSGLGSRAARAHDPSWVVPPGARKAKNPVKVTPEGLAAAADIFHENCAPCHGDKGAGDGEMAQYLKKAKPSNFTDAAMMNEMTDGEIFWKLTEGRPPMPPWKDQLTDTQRWQLVNYLRTLPVKDVAQTENEHMR